MAGVTDAHELGARRGRSSARVRTPPRAPRAAPARFSEDPFVPIFAGLVVVVLGRGLFALVSGDRRTSYRMMRYRVLFQGSVVLAVLYGMYFRVGAATGSGAADIWAGSGRQPAVDKRWFLKEAREAEAEAATAAAVAAAASAPER
jgi:hypothetical protein